MSGTTYLDVREREGVFVISFSSHQRGAPDWYRITDAMRDAISQLKLIGADPDEIKRLDGDQFLGRGARLRMRRPYFFGLLGLWLQDRHVTEALDDGSLQIQGTVPDGWRRLAKKFVERMQTKVADER